MSERTILPGRRQGVVTIPSSKSIAHRALIASYLSGSEPPTVRGESNDTRATRNCLRAFASGERLWPCGESGTTLRLLEPLAGVLGLQGEFVCEGRLGERPRMPFKRQSRYAIAGNVSSQFVSGLLMALPLADWDSEILVEDPLQSEAYVRLTEDVLRASGIVFEKDNFHWFVKGGQRYRYPGGGEVEGDWSQAAFFLAMGVDVRGLDALSHQGDRAVVGFLNEIRECAEGRDTTLDLSQTPDLYPVLAAFAAAIKSPVRFIGTERLRFKESDRLASTAQLIESVRQGSLVKTFNDHRIAMSAAVMASYAARSITIDEADVVNKSYPEFWNDFDRLERKAP